MSYALGQDKIIGVACLGITHPHTSGRLKAVQRMRGPECLAHMTKALCSRLSLRHSICKVAARQRFLLIPSRCSSYTPEEPSMADLAIEALEAGKAVPREKPAGRGSADTARIVEAWCVRAGCSRLATVGATRLRSTRCKSYWRAAGGQALFRYVLMAGCSHDEAGTDHMRNPATSAARCS